MIKITFEIKIYITIKIKKINIYLKIIIIFLAIIITKDIRNITILKIIMIMNIKI